MKLSRSRKAKRRKRIHYSSRIQIRNHPKRKIAIPTDLLLILDLQRANRGDSRRKSRDGKLPKTR
jgi:hypothetical protein